MALKSAGEERYENTLFRCGGGESQGGWKIYTLTCHLKGINFPAGLGQAPPTADKLSCILQIS
eukprot:2161552-Pyramimonas_sp.AAC.1